VYTVNSKQQTERKMSQQTFTPSQVAQHNTPPSLYITIDGSVYDVTKFVDEHPGGAKILKRVAGKDASKQFWKVCLSPRSCSVPFCILHPLFLLSLYFLSFYFLGGGNGGFWMWSGRREGGVFKRKGEGQRRERRLSDGGLTNGRRQYHNESVLKKYGPKLKIGAIKEEAKL
jgi:predicted heme/steroid binding protein